MHVLSRCREAMEDCSRKLGCFWPSGGSGEPKWRSLGPVFIWITDRWALVLILGCTLLGVPVSSDLWAILVSGISG